MSPHGMLIQLLTPLLTWTMGGSHFPSDCKLALCGKPLSGLLSHADEFCSKFSF